MQRPISFGSLLHNIVPSKNLAIFIPGEKIERRSRKFKKLWFFIGITIADSFNDPLSERRLRTFMRFVDNDKIPIQQEDILVFIKFTANGFRAAQILNRSKIHKRDICIDKVFYIFAFCLRAKFIICIVKNLMEIFVPAFVDDGTMGENKCLLEL